MKKETKNNNGVKLIVIGAIIFILRYIPFFYNYEISNTWISLERSSDLCNIFEDGLILGDLVYQCDWIEPFNFVVITISVGLMIYGISILIEKANKEVI